jgi:uroporphyrinogen decarboxylase
LNSKERAIRNYLRKDIDRIPMDISFDCQEVIDSLYKYLKINDYEKLLRLLHIDYRDCVIYTSAGVVREKKDSHIVNGWGVRISTKGGMPLEHPLANASSVDDIEKYQGWLNPDEVNYEAIEKNMEKHKEYAVYGGYWAPFLYISQMLMGMDNMFVMMYEEPEMIEYLLDKIVNICLNINRRIFDRVGDKMQIFYMGDDYGTQLDLMMAPEMWEKFIKPRVKSLYDLAKSYGYVVQQHSCGSIKKVIPQLIEIGMQGLNPIQVAAKDMKIDDLKKSFGKDIVFVGSIDTQTTLPFGSKEDVKAEVLHRIKNIAYDGGFVLAPSQAFMTDVPLENILTMYDTGYKYGFYDSLGKERG